MSALALSFIQFCSTYSPHPEGVRLEAWHSEAELVDRSYEYAGSRELTLAHCHRGRLGRHGRANQELGNTTFMVVWAQDAMIEGNYRSWGWSPWFWVLWGE